MDRLRALCKLVLGKDKERFDDNGSRQFILTDESILSDFYIYNLNTLAIKVNQVFKVKIPHINL
jgi:hypothetical protein